MGVTIAYNILFEVKVLHHFFLNKGETGFDHMSAEEQAQIMLNYDVRDFLEIYPTPDCIRVLDAHKCIFKATSQGIVVGIRAEANNENPPLFVPFNPFPVDQVFAFAIQLRDMNFLNYTALPFDESSGKAYIFKNFSNGSPLRFPDLSSSPPSFKNGRVYFPGDMVSNDPNNFTSLFTAINKTTNPTSDTTDWQAEHLSPNVPLNYANSGDRHNVSHGMLLYKVNVPDLAPAITVKTALGSIISPEINILSGDYRTVQIDMRGFPDGFYTVDFESLNPPYTDSFSFYLLQGRTRPFGILNLAMLSNNPAYNMIDETGCLRSPVYHLRFRNRRTYWRYVGKNFNSGSVTEGPLPLTRYGVIHNVKVKNKDGEDVHGLPNPGNAPIKTEALRNQGENKFYSEIHIN